MAVTSCGRYGEPGKRSIVNPVAAKSILAQIGANVDRLLPLDSSTIVNDSFNFEPPYDVWREIYSSADDSPHSLIGAVLAHRISVRMSTKSRLRHAGPYPLRMQDKHDLRVLSDKLNSADPLLAVMTNIITRERPIIGEFKGLFSQGTRAAL